MTGFDLFDPRGAIEIERLHAPRLDAFEDKRIGFLSNDMWQAPRILPRLREALATRYPQVEFVAESKLPRGMKQIDGDEAAEAVVAAGLDGVIVANAS